MEKNYKALRSGAMVNMWFTQALTFIFLGVGTWALATGGAEGSLGFVIGALVLIPMSFLATNQFFLIRQLESERGGESVRTSDAKAA